MSQKPKQRKCRCCSEFFFPDDRNQERQRYCSKPACQHASKLASQRRWLRTPCGRRYFREGDNVERVRQWRQAHPGYWKPKTLASGDAQVIAPQELKPSPLGTLQDSCLAQDPGFIGLISLITGRTLQEDIAPIARRVVEQGQNILGLKLPESP